MPDALHQLGYGRGSFFLLSAGSDAEVRPSPQFCIFSAPYTANVGDIERIAVAYCAQPGHGARLIPSGTFKNLHYVSTPHYVQITAEGDFTKLKIKPGDEGGELDPHGYDGKGNPIGGLVFGGFASGKPEQFADWTEFISDSELCIRACHNGPDAGRYCQHIYVRPVFSSDVALC